MKTAYVTIGNSDDGLHQTAWHMMCHELQQIMHDCTRAIRGQVFGVWFSNSDSQYQNACVSFQIDEGQIGILLNHLADLARRYEQDSIALAIVDSVEMVKPTGS